jgi:hypothetical protein
MIEFKRIDYHTTSDRLRIDWRDDGKADVAILMDKEHVINVVVPRQTLIAWRDDIDMVLRGRPKA